MDIVDYVAGTGGWKDQLMLGLWGGTKGGKTRAALCFPDPICMLSVDREPSPVIEQVGWRADGSPKKIRLAQVLPDKLRAVTKEDAQVVLDWADRLAQEAMLNNQGTFVLDGGSTFYELARVALLGSARVGGRGNPQYAVGEVYQYINDFFARFLKSKTNVVVTFQQRKVFSGADWTGKWEPRAPGPLGHWLQASIHCGLDYVYNNETKLMQPNFYFEMYDNAFNASLNKAKIGWTNINAYDLLHNIFFGAMSLQSLGAAAEPPAAENLASVSAAAEMPEG